MLDDVPADKVAVLLHLAAAAATQGAGTYAIGGKHIGQVCVSAARSHNTGQTPTMTTSSLHSESFSEQDYRNRMSGMYVQRCQ